ncbi:hypothetical protein D0T49_07585 [Paludibacter sp. 221]|uniref:GyrI-like domain-containing protein n=1 Tax=Paludibacter sp. 221 TaxID=2302939 RepID=UPI0013D3B775|nr:GyrI-like domain-containing protein [Paludibacter sp. 221]NDV46907.1 hypothetical protein [Paludibacter sp. 221]
MKKIIRAVLFTIVIFAALFAVFYGYYGGFRKVQFTVAELDSQLLTYEDVTGEYSQTPQISNRVYSILLNEFGVETYKGFGIFYDNPQDTEQSKMRSEVGCILDGISDSLLISRIETKLKVKTLPAGQYIATDFPFKGNISIMMGIMKVYPALNKYKKANGMSDAPIIEIYDVPAKKITYLQQVK